MNHDQIRAQAKKIMDEFTKALEGAADATEFGTRRDDQTRIPTEEKYPGFKKLILKNAPRKNEDYIIAEKKNW